MTFLRPTDGRKYRRGFPITAYVGGNGGGKTCAMVWDTIPTLESGRYVLSTVRLLDYLDPRPCDDASCVAEDHGTHQAAHPLWVPFTDWWQLMDWRDGDVLMDEVTGVASSRASHAMPDEVGNRLNQLRRKDVILRWTAPSWRRADTIIREVSQAVVSCKGTLSVEAKSTDGSGEDLNRVWRQKRLFWWKTYDGMAFEDFTAGTKERLSVKDSDRHWGPGSPAFAAYDTYDSVLSIGTVSASGRCMECGGRRSAPACRCAVVEPLSRRRASASARGPAQRGGPIPAHSDSAEDVSGSDVECAGEHGPVAESA